MMSLRRARVRRMGALTFAFALMCASGSASARAQTPAAGAVSSQPGVSVPLPGADPQLDARVKAVASRLRCPVCQGESIQDSPAELAAQMKGLVREQLAAGKSEQQVLDYFTQKYGQWILLEPKAEGINLLVYGLPIVFLLLGGVGIVMAVKKWSRPVPAPRVTADGTTTIPADETVP